MNWAELVMGIVSGLVAGIGGTLGLNQYLKGRAPRSKKDYQDAAEKRKKEIKEAQSVTKEESSEYWK